MQYINNISPMKLLTNYKDYYDFLIQKYWIDEKAFYRRVTEIDSMHGVSIWFEGEPKMQNQVYAIAFCWKVISVAKYEWRIHVGEDISNNYYSSDEDQLFKSIHWEETDINDNLDCPVILLTRFNWFVKDDAIGWRSKRTWRNFASAVRNPNLINFWIDKVLSPEDAFIQISNFLLKSPSYEDNRSDIDKVQSHGFDTKRSFRPNMK